MLEEVFAADGASADSPALDMAGRIVAHWARQSSPRHAARREGPLRARMLRCLARLGTTAPGERFLREVLVEDYDGSENAALAEAAPAMLAAQPLQQLLAALVESAFLRCPRALCELLFLLDAGNKAQPSLGACRAWGVDSAREARRSQNRPQRGQFLPDSQAHSPAMGQETGVHEVRRSQKWTAAVDLQPTLPKSDRLLAGDLALRRFAGALVDALPGLAARPEHSESYWSLAYDDTAADAVSCHRLLWVLERLASGEHHATAVTALIAQPQVFDPGRVLVPALQALCAAQEHGGIDREAQRLRLWSHCCAFLLARSEFAPTAPGD